MTAVIEGGRGVTWVSELLAVVGAQRGRRPSGVAPVSRACVRARLAASRRVRTSLTLSLYYYYNGVPWLVSRSVSRSVPLAVSLMPRKRRVAGHLAVPFAVS